MKNKISSFRFPLGSELNGSVSEFIDSCVWDKIWVINITSIINQTARNVSIPIKNNLR